MDGDYILGKRKYDLYALDISKSFNYLVAAGVYGIIEVWDLNEDENLRYLIDNHTAAILSCVISEMFNGNYYLACYKQNQILIWDYNKQAQVFYKNPSIKDKIHSSFDDSEIRKVSFVPKNKYFNDLMLACIDNYGYVSIFSVLGSNKSIIRLEPLSKTRKSNWSSMSFSNDGEYVATYHEDDDRIRIWKWFSQEIVAELKIPQGVTIYDLSFNDNNNFLASCSSDSLLIIWDFKRERVFKYFKERSAILSCKFSPDGKYLSYACADKKIILLRTTDFGVEKFYEMQIAAARVLEFSQCGKYLAAGGLEGIKIWNLESDEIINHLEAHYSIVSGLSFSPDGKYIASCGWDGALNIYKQKDE